MMFYGLGSYQLRRDQHLSHSHIAALDAQASESGLDPAECIQQSGAKIF